MTTALQHDDDLLEANAFHEFLLGIQPEDDPQTSYKATETPKKEKLTNNEIDEYLLAQLGDRSAAHEEINLHHDPQIGAKRARTEPPARVEPEKRDLEVEPPKTDVEDEEEDEEDEGVKRARTEEVVDKPEIVVKSEIEEDEDIEVKEEIEEEEVKEEEVKEEEVKEEIKEEDEEDEEMEGELDIDMQQEPTAEIVLRTDRDVEEDAECDWYAEQAKDETERKEEDNWDDSCIVVRQGQLQVDMMDRDPPMLDEQLQNFTEWLSRQLGVVVNNYPYVKRSGATVDLSGNLVGPKGLDRLFTVLRDHRVPCVTLKAYRNLLDDTIVNTLVEYLYTQPEAHPIHGIHMSHNLITNKGAMRLIKAADQCGHYPRKLTCQPLWLRLESNAITNPEEFVRDCQIDGVRLCVMKDGLCSSPTCDHLKNVAVQLPHFFQQPKNAPHLHGRAHAGGKPRASDGKGSSKGSGKKGNRRNDKGGKGGGYKGNKKGNDWLAATFGPDYVPLGKRKSIDIDLPVGGIGFDFEPAEEGRKPRITSVDSGSEVMRQGVHKGMELQRINGLDTSMLTPSQIKGMLAKRPISLRIGC